MNRKSWRIEASPAAQFPKTALVWRPRRWAPGGLDPAPSGRRLAGERRRRFRLSVADFFRTTLRFWSRPWLPVNASLTHSTLTSSFGGSMLCGLCFDLIIAIKLYFSFDDNFFFFLFCLEFLKTKDFFKRTKFFRFFHIDSMTLLMICSVTF